MGTGGSESNRVSRAAVETDASPHASPSTTCTPALLPHHKMIHPPATPLPQESAQPLPPSSHNTMGGGLADHELAAAATGGSEFSHASEDFDMFTFTSRAHAEASQRSGVHTRFPEDGIDQTSVLVVS